MLSCTLRRSASPVSDDAPGARAAPTCIGVVGDGQVGLTAAIVLRRSYPRSDVVLIAAPPDPAALADAAITSWPTTLSFHDSFGFDEAGLILRAGASHRLATRYIDWCGEGRDWVLAYGAALDPAMRVSFGDDWPSGSTLQRQRASPVSVGPRTVAQALASSGRFAMPVDNPESPLSDIDYALRWNGPAYRSRLASLARHMGVRHLTAGLSQLAYAGDGSLNSVTCEDGSMILADWWLDCSGPAARLRAAASEPKFESWADMLPVDRLLVDDGKASPALSLEDRLLACEDGWAWQVFGRDAAHASFGYASGLTSDAAAAASLKRACGASAVGKIVLRPGRLCAAWAGNVIAIADAAASFEPLHGLNLHLAHRQLGLLLELLPARDIDPGERDEYNRRAALLADGARDWIAAHYCSPVPREGAFWYHAGAQRRSDALAVALQQFGARGRIPHFEDAPVGQDGWAAVLAGIGAGPGRSALLAAKDPAQRIVQQAALERRCSAALALARPYPEWLSARLANPQ